MLLCAATFLSGQQTSSPEMLPDSPPRREKGWTPLLNGSDLSGWHSILGWRGVPDRLNEWQPVTSLAWRSEDPKRLSAKPGPSGTILNGIDTHTTNLVSNRKFGDTELYVEFLLSQGSNAGVYLQGLYEVQVFDSFGKTGPLSSSDGGGIYQRWENNRGFGGSPPRRNASRAPGEWQSFHIWFRAPRFDAQGRKTENARFLRVLYNGVLVQEDVACDGPTRSALEIPEAAENPLMLQGDHGPVAFRNLYVHSLRPPSR